MVLWVTRAVSGDAASVHRRRHGHGSGTLSNGIPAFRAARRGHAPERRTAHAERREPPRMEPGAGPRYRHSRHGSGNGGFPSQPYQRGAHLPLSEPISLVWHVRPKRHLYDGRNQSGKPWLVAEAGEGRAKLERAREPARMEGMRARPRKIHVRTGQEPCFHPLLVMRQRILCRG